MPLYGFLSVLKGMAQSLINPTPIIPILMAAQRSRSQRVFQERFDRMHRDRRADVQTRHQRIDPDQLAMNIDQRAAGVSWSQFQADRYQFSADAAKPPRANCTGLRLR